MADLGTLWFDMNLRNKRFLDELKRTEAVTKETTAKIEKMMQPKDREVRASEKHELDILMKKQKIEQQIENQKAKMAAQQERISAQQDKRIQQAAVHSSRLLSDEQKLMGLRQRQNQQAEAHTMRMAAQKQRLENQVNRVNNAYVRQGRLLSQLRNATLGYISVWQGVRFLKTLMETSGEFELQEKSLAAIIQNAEKAHEIFNQIKKLSIQSPFQFKDMMSYTKQLAAFSIPTNELFQTTKELADVSAGLGVEMYRIILAYGQVRSAAVLRGQELRQFTEAGIPLVQKLADKFSLLEGRVVSAGEVFQKISQRMVPFEMIKEIFTDMTKEGGMFFNMQEIQAETLKGKLSNLKDAYQVMLSEIGKARDGVLKGSVDLVFEIFDNWERVADILKVVISSYGTYKAVLLAVAIIEKSREISRASEYYRILITRVDELTASTRAFGAAQAGLSKANVWGLVLSGVVALGVGLHNTYKRSVEFKKSLEDMYGDFEGKTTTNVYELDKLRKTIVETEEGSEEYRKAVEILFRKYKEFLPEQLNIESGFLDIARAADQARISILEQAKALAISKASQAGLDKIASQQLKTITSGTNIASGKGLFSPMFKTKEMASQFVSDFMMEVENNPQANIQYLFDKLVKSDKYADSYTGTITDKFINQFRDYSSTLNTVNEQQEVFNRLINQSFNGVGNNGKPPSEGVSDLTKETREWAKVSNEIANQNKNWNIFKVGNEEHERLTYVNRLRDEYKNLDLQQREMIGAKVIDQKEVELIKSRAEGIQKISEALGFNLKGAPEEKDPRRSGSTIDLWAEGLKKNYELIKSFRTEYEKLRDRIGVSGAKSTMLLSPKYLGLDKEYLDKPSDEIMGEFFRKLGNASSKEAVEFREKLLTDMFEFTSNETTNAVEKSMQAISLELSNLKTKFNLYQDLIAEGDKGSAAGINFGVKFDGEPNLMKYLMNQLANISGKDTKLTLDFDSNFESLFEDYDAAEKALGSEKMNVLKEIFDATKEEDERQSSELRKTLNDYLTYSEAMQRITAKYEAKRKALGYITPEQNSYLVADEEKEKADLTREYAERTESFRTWIDDITYLGLKEVQDLLGKVQLELMQAQASSKGGDTDQVGQLRAKIAVLQETIKNLQKKEDKDGENSSDALKRWRSLRRELGYVDKAINEIADNLGGIAGEFLRTAGTITTSIVGMVGGIEKLTSAAAASMSAVEKASIILTAISYAFKIFDAVKNFFDDSEEREYQNKLERERNNLAREYNRILIERMAIEDNMFSGNRLKHTTDSIKAYAEAVKAFNDWYNKSLSWVNAVGYTVEIGKMRNLLKYYKTAKDQEKKRNAQYLPSEITSELFKGGKFNLEYAKELLNSMSSLTDESRAYLEELIKAQEAVNALKEQIDSLIDETFGHLGDSLTESIISGFVNGADAGAEEFKNSINETLEDVARQIIRMAFLQRYINQLRDNITSIYEDYAKTDQNPYATELFGKNIMDALANFFQSYSLGLDASDNFLKMFQEEAKKRGFDVFQNAAETGTLSKGIQTVTEDTANLLGSYINAIRADVSVQRYDLNAIRVAMDNTRELVNLQYAELQAINANTLRNADAADRIEALLVSVTNGTKKMSVQ